MFRNRELRRFAALFVGIAAVATAVGLALHPAAGVLVLVSAAAFGAVFWGFTRARYRRIAKLSEQIDRVLLSLIHISLQSARAGMFHRSP